ncbi:hypothetical protein HK097_000334 [Rhizophlyctis rosea]|uniref:3'-5' exonuclease domain-containing protein n=1 Tax=Rhizophlyctis rosea TaxID=64517 RepID=A0AAD5X235_9FUNG|nr:hypothetical protein HK097_000334 [Rhizophlyctis rosea]
MAQVAIQPLSARETDEYVRACRQFLVGSQTITQRLLHWRPPPLHPALGGLPYSDVTVFASADSIRLEKLLDETFCHWRNRERTPKYQFISLDCQFAHFPHGQYNALIQLGSRSPPTSFDCVVGQTTWLHSIPPTLKLLLKDDRIIKLTHSGSNDRASLAKWMSPNGEKLKFSSFIEIDAVARLFWRLSGDALANNPNKPSLSSLAQRFLGISLADPDGGAGRRWDDPDIQAKMLRYAVKDSWATMEIFLAIKYRIDLIAGSEQAGTALVQQLLVTEMAKDGVVEVL